MIGLAVVLGLAIGMIVGAVGGGGAILALPVLVYVLGEPVGPASTASLVVVSLAAAIGAGSLARHGRVCWRLAFTFAAPAALGSILGTAASHEIGGDALILAFVPVMALAAVLTWKRAGESGDEGECPDPPRSRTLLAGLLVGVLTGFFGVGGGFVIVPVLSVWLGTPFRRAVATSLVIIALTGVVALASHLAAGSRPDLAVTGTLSAATGAGALLGTLFAERVPQSLLRRGFAVLVGAVALALLIDVLALGGPPGR
ncbi:sulfite exporter TauE/SafE family protein [Solirubrobacter sp. CPCC 204708]|uniref:Probable membrane transporter protein n=1 Tax=Solirubrobacter deserti TaxID=2282478 RepID=A0ABT4REB4_9ACTN|nr:sulfite exporter TauE/SafE family protein [Solirubrobacter deserti]MBE2316125.1 sulfite exporter TauE/SafE family protein [Solirubrobacter deserti]MDA0136875.1 sulfite exporter TauE/SafE family protein [Solirubrobacter deserti]